MKLVTAIIKPQRLDEVRDTLSRLGVTGMTVTEVKGFGRQKGHTEKYRGAEFSVDFVQKVKIDLVVADASAQEITDAIRTSAWTGQIGDGKVFVSNMEEAIRIRTDETGEEAL